MCSAGPLYVPDCVGGGVLPFGVQLLFLLARALAEVRIAVARTFLILFGEQTGQGEGREIPCLCRGWGNRQAYVRRSGSCSGVCPFPEP